ncbi:hypothetical protein Acr_00g0082710 [Actinidia rufa]|uniref:Uncharacterized protein n=1 Tax=Actinidia rufa TaxID=165716 RepID=A0A7J0DVZ4_9ERIC|nr:hypothetical protein Acr_00g0082710 [Actinidia rufa]
MLRRINLKKLAQKVGKSKGRESHYVEEFYHDRKILEAVIPPFNKEEVDKLELNWVVSKFFHIIGQEWDATMDILDAIEMIASRYFREGFDFFKWQLHHHHPNLSIYLNGMDIDQDLLEEEEDELEEKQKREGKEEEDGDQNGDPFSP